MKSKYLFFVVIIILTGCCSKERNNMNSKTNVIRKGAVIKLKPEQLDFYKELHANPWEGVQNKLKECNIQNYSIYYRDGYLFSYMEYHGENWEEDMEKLAADSTTQEWWKLTDPCQEPVPSANEEEWWAELEEVFHLD